MGRDTLKPKIGDRKIINGKRCIYIPDPWSPLASFLVWANEEELEKDHLFVTIK